MRALPTATLTLIAVVAFGLAVPRPAAATSYTLTTLASFNGANGDFPRGDLIRDAQGNLFGTAESGGGNGDGTVFVVPAGTGFIGTLASFNGANGAAPFGGLVRDAQGNLFGTTYLGGGAFDSGTVFELAAGSGTLTTLASFNGANANPFGSLVRDAQGNLYGTTQNGGLAGSVFELAAGSHTITTLASFHGANGANPVAGLVRDAQGNLFGTTSGGLYNQGTVFELAAGSGTLTTLASFNGANGANPVAGLVRDAQGNLFGTTEGGGAFGQGTVFVVPTGTGFIATLASFNGANGSLPGNGTLVRDAQGNLFGTTYRGGGPSDSGTVFELAAGSGTLTTLASFNGANGAYPLAGVTLDAQGDLFGATTGGGAFNDGTVFELSPVPEPASLVLLGLGMVGLAGLALWARARQSGVGRIV